MTGKQLEQAKAKTFTAEEMEEWSSRQWIGLSLLNIYERFGGDFTPTECNSIKGAIKFFIPGWSEPVEPEPEPMVND